MTVTNIAARAKQFNAMLKVLRDMDITLRRQIVRVPDDGRPYLVAQYAFAGGVGKARRKLTSRSVVVKSHEAKAFNARWDIWQLDASYHDTDASALTHLVKHSDSLGDQGWDPEILVGRGKGGVALLLVYANQVDGNFIEVEDRRRC
jgi:hypothetical protein